MSFPPGLPRGLLGVPNGVAALDDNGLVPTANLPADGSSGGTIASQNANAVDITGGTVVADVGNATDNPYPTNGGLFPRILKYKGRVPLIAMTRSGFSTSDFSQHFAQAIVEANAEYGPYSTTSTGNPVTIELPRYCPMGPAYGAPMPDFLCNARIHGEGDDRTQVILIPGLIPGGLGLCSFVGDPRYSTQIQSGHGPNPNPFFGTGAEGISFFGSDAFTAACVAAGTPFHLFGYAGYFQIGRISRCKGYSVPGRPINFGTLPVAYATTYGLTISGCHETSVQDNEWRDCGDGNFTGSNPGSCTYFAGTGTVSDNLHLLNNRYYQSRGRAMEFHGLAPPAVITTATAAVSANTTVPVASTTGLKVAFGVTGSGIPAGTGIQSIGSGYVVLNNAVTLTSGETLTFQSQVGGFSEITCSMTVLEGSRPQNSAPYLGSLLVFGDVTDQNNVNGSLFSQVEFNTLHINNAYGNFAGIEFNAPIGDGLNRNRISAGFAGTLGDGPLSTGNPTRYDVIVTQLSSTLLLDMPYITFGGNVSANVLVNQQNASLYVNDYGAGASIVAGTGVTNYTISSPGLNTVSGTPSAPPSAAGTVSVSPAITAGGIIYGSAPLLTSSVNIVTGLSYLNLVRLPVIGTLPIGGSVYVYARAGATINVEADTTTNTIEGGTVTVSGATSLAFALADGLMGKFTRDTATTWRVSLSAETAPATAPTLKATAGATSFAASSSPGILTVTAAAAATAITLPTQASVISSRGKGQQYVYKDATGNSGTYPITLTASGGALIDGAASYTINTNWGSAMLIPDGTNWSVVG
jgi:hypothetical protein